MKKTNQDKHKWNPVSWGKIPKRALAMGLAVALMGGMVDLSPLVADARTQTAEKQSTITAFQTLPQDIREQQLPLGAQESDINFPDTLTVTLQQNVTVSGKQETEEKTEQEKITGEDSANPNRETNEITETKESGENAAEESRGELDSSSGEKKGQQESLENPETENQKAGNTSGDTPQTENPEEQQEEARNAASGDTDNTQNTAENVETTKTVEKESTLENIRWELDKEESDAAEFDAGEASNGFCYVYTPVLPDTDEDGNTLAVGDDVELPAIYVLVGEPQIALLNADDVAEVIVNGTSTTYATVNDAFAAIQTAISNASGNVDITLKFLADTVVTGLDCELDGEGKTNLTIDMNGKEVGIDWDNGGSSLHFELTMTNIEATLTGTGTLSATVYIRENANLTVKDAIEYRGTLRIQEGGTAALKDLNGCGSVVTGDVEIQDGGSCTITGGAYGTIKVDPGANLEVSGDATEIRTLYAYPPEKNGDTVKKRAEIALSGGIYASIKLVSGVDSSTLENESFKCAIIDMLADGYSFYKSADTGIDATPARTVTELKNVKVLSEPEVIVSFQITEKDGTTETKDFATWDKAMSYLSDSSNETEFTTWKKVEIILQKDASFSQIADQMVSLDKLSAELVLCSAGDEIYTLSADGNPSYKAYTALHTNGQNLTVENIKTSGASIKTVGGTVTIRSGADLAAREDTIKVTGSTLILEKGARVSSTSTDENGWAAIHMADTGILRIKKGAQITKGEVNITGSNNESIVVIEEGAELSAIGSVSNAVKACVYCNLDSTTRDVWIAMTGGKVYFPIECNGVTLDTSGSDSNITEYEGTIYGRFYRDPETYTSSNTKIKVPDTVCSYELTDGTKTAVEADHTFQMPSAKVKLLTHNPDASGYCPSCGKTDLETAYENGKLQINGLTGRTYDSWPQSLTGITLTGADGSTTALIGPSYTSGKELAQDSTNTANANLTSADYALVYANNINAYDKKQGDSGFDESKAPKVTITGQGKYTGTIEYYFTIGQGNLLTKDFKVYDNLTYTGKQQKVLQYGTLAYEADGTDADTPIKQAGQSGADASISVCTGKTIDTDGFASVAATKIAYSTDNGSTWKEIDESATDKSGQNYCITDAGSYDFQIRATDGENAVSAAQSLTATIQPKSLNSQGVDLDNSQSITVYYTGKAIVPTDKDHSISDKSIEVSEGDYYVLEKGKDFTTSAENNTNVSDEAKLIITGIGNYTDTLMQKFSIVYAFDLAQTTASTDHWYNTDVPAVFGLDDTTGGTADAANQLVYRSEVILDTRYDQYHTELNGDVKLYATLQDAINGTNEGYTFTGEGEQTKTLYGRDTAVKGYIANPIDITVKIDKTAPTWADENGNVDNYGIQIKDNWWRTLLNTISFGLFYNDATMDIRIRANDDKSGVREVSGIDKYYYYVDTITNTADDMAAKTKSDLDALAEQDRFTSVAAGTGSDATISGKLSSKGNYVVYAYAVDKAGNKSDYICTEGLVMDSDAPELTITDPKQSEGTLKDTEATITINSDEAGTWEYFYVHENEFVESSPNYAEFCQNVDNYIKDGSSSTYRTPFAEQYDGKWRPEVELGESDLVEVGQSRRVWMYSTELKAGENTLTITDLKPSEKCKVWLIAIDKAGNITGDMSEPVKTVTFTTTKAMPRITTLPQLSGVYGDTPAELTVTPGVAKYNDSEVLGTWTVESTDTTKLEVGTTEQYTVKFTPNNSDYAEAYVKVTPTITKRPITIQVMDRIKTYKEPLPDITVQDSFLVIPTEQLVAGDSDADVRGSLRLVTEATAESEVGIYPFTVTSDSPNYEVTANYFAGNSINGFTRKLEQHGTLKITPAAGKLEQGADYQADRTVTYGDAPFSLDVTANHTESSIQYQVTDEKDADGNTISADDHIVSVSADGMVTINGAGSAKIQISLPASKNYTASAGLSVTVTVARKDFTVPEQSRSYLYDRDSSDTIDLATLLPKDCGKASYTVSTKTDAVFETATVTQDGKLSYKVKTGTIGTTGEIQVGIKTANYTIHGNSGSSGQITIKAALVDKKPVETKTTVSVKNPTLTYGEPVSKLQFNPSTFVEQGTDQTVAGTLQWDTPDTVLSAGAQSVIWIFTPDNDEYQSVTGSLTITVNRAAPRVEKVPVPGAYVYHPTNTLASDNAKDVLNSGAKVQGVVTDAQDRTVAGSWSWKEQSEVLNAGTHTYTAVFTPTDGANYETVEKPVTLTVEKAYVSIKDEIGSLHLPSYKHGDYLYNHELTTGSAYYAGKGEDYNDVDKTIAEVRGRYVWAAPETRVKYTDGKLLSTGYYQAEYELEFIPDDTTNYAGTMETKNGWSGQKMASVVLNKADNPPYRPSAQIIVANTCQKVSDVKLPQDWRWYSNDGDKPLEDNQPVSAHAEYTGSDSECYSNAIYEIDIIRSTCDHAQTEVKNAKAATCSSEGSTGETWCTVCGVKLDDGYVLVKDSTNHTHLVSKVIKDATTTQEGIMSYSCTDCGYYAEKAIAKLPSGGGSGSSGSGGSGSGSSTSGSSGNSGNTGENNSKNTTGVAEIVPSPVTPVIAPVLGQLPQNGTGSRKTTGEETKGELAKPFLRNADGKEGWEVITAEAKAAAEGETLVVDMNGASVVPADVFEEIQGKDITIEFDLGNGITWKVNGLSVQEGRVGNIDFGVKLGADAADTIPVEVINQVTGERMSLNLSLAYEGTFGFEAVLTVKLGKDSAGLFANLFYYNEETGNLEFMCAREIREDGSVDLNFSHASEYTIVIDTKSMEQEIADDGISTNAGDDQGQADAALEEKNTVPDIAWILLLAAVVGIIAVGVVIQIHRQKSEEE